MAGEFHRSVASLESTLLNVVSRRRIIQESVITPIHKMRLPGLKVFWIPLVTSFIGMKIPDFIERWFVAPLLLLTYQNDARSTALQVLPGTAEDCFLDFREEHSQGPYEVALYEQGLAPTMYEALRIFAIFLVASLLLVLLKRTCSGLYCQAKTVVTEFRQLYKNIQRCPLERQILFDA